MKVDHSDLYHGAALLQIAQQDTFTAINGFVFRGQKSPSAFSVNEAGVYFKYATEPHGKFKEYIFNFTDDNFDELDRLEAKHGKGSAFVALICVKAKQVCCFPYGKLLELRTAREKEKGGPEKILAVLVTIPAGANFRVYVNCPNTRGHNLELFKVPRNSFPAAVFRPVP